MIPGGMEEGEREEEEEGGREGEREGEKEREKRGREREEREGERGKREGGREKRGRERERREGRRKGERGRRERCREEAVTFSKPTLCLLTRYTLLQYTTTNRNPINIFNVTLLLSIWTCGNKSVANKPVSYNGYTQRQF